MPHVVSHLLELVEDHAFRLLGQLMCLIENFLDVGLGARCRNNLAGNRLQPVKALAAHALRKDSYRVTVKKLGVERAAAAVIACGRPDCLVVIRVELAGDKARRKASEGGADFVAAGREPFADHADDLRFYSRQLRRKNNVIRTVEETAALLLLILPCDSEEVQRIYIPEADAFQLFLDGIRDQIRISHLCYGRNNDVVLPCSGDIMFKSLFVNLKIDHFTSS